MKLRLYLQDGAGYQARCVLNCLLNFSWSWPNAPDEPNIARWENGRENGYVLYLSNKSRKQLNIAFSESRNSDAIKVLRWVQTTFNPPNIDSAKQVLQSNPSEDCGADVFQMSFEQHQFMAAAEWIYESFGAHCSGDVDDCSRLGESER